GGLTKTRDGEDFVRDALQNEKKVGVIEITLIEPSIGENLRTQWLAILFSFIIHGLLRVGYYAVARPSRTEYLARINNESRLKFEIQTLTQALEQEKHNAALAIAQVQQALKNKPKEKDSKPVVLDTDSLSLNIQFYDPKQLLDS